LSVVLYDTQTGGVKETKRPRAQGLRRSKPPPAAPTQSWGSTRYGKVSRDLSREGGSSVRRRGMVLHSRHVGGYPEAHARHRPRSPAPGRRPGAQARRAAWARRGEDIREARASSRPLGKNKKALCRRLLTSPGAPTRDSCAALWVRPAARAARSTAAAGVAGRDPSREGGGQARRLGAVLQTRQGGDTLEAHARSRPRSPAPTKNVARSCGRATAEFGAQCEPQYHLRAFSIPPPALSRSARVPCRAHAGAPEAPTPL